jgi:catechol 2,3-dioxygenase-like lactoylglutathione lyase family enzyme
MTGAFRLLFAVVLLFLARLGPLAVSAPPSDDSVSAVESVAIVVEDMQRSVRFFTEVLGFQKVHEAEVTGAENERLHGVFGLRVRVVRLQLGDEFIELMDFIAPEGRPIPQDARSNDLSFQHVALIVSDMEKAYARLRAHSVRHVSAGPQRLPDWNPNAGGIEAFYFKDPDGHVLEILEFPSGKGAAKWQRKDRLFLGIDHTAIVVDDTARSLRFYKDGLGLDIAGESENYGIEQERLNGVFGARLKITALRASSGPGIEFLDYLAPSDGRPAPSDLQSNDLLAWQTRVVSERVEGTLARLLGGTFAFVSPGLVKVPDSLGGFSTGVLVRDPDGHRVMLVQK